MFQTDADSCGDKRKNCSDEQLAQKAKGGDTDALAQLISHFLPVIKAKSGRYSLVGLEQDDFIQEGLIGLFNAVKNYDPARGASFDTYARRCIHSRMAGVLPAAGGGAFAQAENQNPFVWIRTGNLNIVPQRTFL